MRRGTLVPTAIPALLLGVLLLSASVARGRESAWCHDQRKKCVQGCPSGSRVKFDCEDRDGARSVSCACAGNEGTAGAAGTSSSSSSSSSGWTSEPVTTATRASVFASSPSASAEKEAEEKASGRRWTSGFPFS
ncbi:hypothetical protein ABPG75_012615 [Micractinium tetrahymenae]